MAGDGNELSRKRVKNWAALRTENQVKWRRSNGMFWP
jgi:hypothetical protein